MQRELIGGGNGEVANVAVDDILSRYVEILELIADSGTKHRFGFGRRGGERNPEDAARRCVGCEVESDFRECIEAGRHLVSEIVLCSYKERNCAATGRAEENTVHTDITKSTT